MNISLKPSGFTLVELYIVLAIASVLAIALAPSMQNFISNNRISTHLNKLIKAIHFSRESAIHLNRTVTLCRSSDGISCSGEWRQGMIAFTDYNKDLKLSEGEKLLHRFEPFPEDDHVYWRAFRNRQYLKMTPMGNTAYQNGTFTYCPKEGIKYAKGIILNAAGRIKLTTDGNKDGIDEGANKKPLRC